MSRAPKRDWNAEVPGLAARRGALRLLTSVLQQGRPLDVALAGALNGIDRPDDRALARMTRPAAWMTHPWAHELGHGARRRRH